MFEANDKIGGQFNYAKAIPGKEDFNDTLRYFTTRMKDLKVPVHLNRRVTSADLANFDHVAVASGVTPRLAPHPWHRPCQGTELPRGDHAPGKGGQESGADRCRRHRL